MLEEQPKHPASTTGQALAWLKACYQGLAVPVPDQLQKVWNLAEERVCFVIERMKTQQHAHMTTWLPLLTDFFAVKQRLELYPLTDDAVLLLAPLSLFPDSEQDGDWGELAPSLLEWAAGIHDLISTEAMETIRVFVAPPVSGPQQLAAALAEIARLGGAVRRFLPKVMVAATWQHRLETWAASLPEQAVTSLCQTLPPLAQLSPEQRETLAALCTHDLNISETARALFIHRNTLLYRLDKLKKQTGLDPRQFSDALLFRLAMLFGQNH
jgi:DNA-binding CsgD family transcriptional regulator